MPDTAGLGELWIRASRLRERCFISVHVVAFPPGWKVSIYLASDSEVAAEGVGEHLVEAMAHAITRAEAMGLGPKPYVPVPEPDAPRANPPG